MKNLMMYFNPSIIGIFLLLISSAYVHAVDFGNDNKVFAPVSTMSRADWSNPQELQRTWDNALVRIPTENNEFISSFIRDLSHSSDKKFPTVIYLHGCSGVWSGTHTRINFLAKSGFAVIAPQSFAREKYPQSCDPASNQGGMYRHTLRIRQNDAMYALTAAQQLSWVDSNNIFLMGLSEGAITTATLKTKDAPLNARIIEGWTCHAGWQEYAGLNTSKHEPVLSLVGEKDPWFHADYLRGDCGKFMSTKNGSRSIVYKESPLKYRHELLEDASVQEVVLAFLKSRMR